MKLFLVTCKGMHGGFGIQPSHGICYVVADDPSKAYTIVRESLDKRDLGFASDRVMESVKLIAEQGNYPPCGTPLYIQEIKV